MSVVNRSGRPLVLACIVSILLILVTFASAPPTAAQVVPNDDHGDHKYKGIVEERPAETMGTWIIGGRSFIVDQNTVFEDGVPNVGDCVEVRYDIVGGQNLARKVEFSNDCPTEDNGGDDHGGHNEYKGIVEQMPAGGLIGTWLISGRTFVTDGSTHFEDTPYLGACVEVKYHVVGGQNLVRKMELSDDCGGEDNGDSVYQEVHGVIEAFPANWIGTWTISGVNYEATQTTYFEQSDGPFAVGVCVEVKYLVQGETNVAVKIKSEDDMCGSAGGGLALQSLKGTVQSFPPPPYYGDWVVSTGTVTRTFHAVSGTTVFKEHHGSFYVGGCVKVKYDSNNIAHEIETESPDDCGASSSPPPGETVLKTTGRVDAMPADLFGTWTVDGVAYEARAGTTILKQEHGQFVVGRCVEVKYYVEGSTNVALKVSTEHDYKCVGTGPGQGESEAYGVIDSLPATPDLVGPWVIGGITYQVTTTTVLEDGPFTVGLLVEVHFVYEADGTLRATKVEGKHESSDDRSIAKLYGRVGVLPGRPDLTGTWTIAGETYNVTPSTRLKQEHGAFQINACVEVYYHLDASHARVADKIETRPDSKCQAGSPGGPEVSRTYGFVDQMPPAGLVGTWIIGGVAYDARASTRFEESHGPFMVGAYVEVHYTIEGGVKVAQKVETHVPPDAGNHTAMGTLQIPPALGATLLTATGQTWIIDGQSYTITDATILDDSQAPFQDGQPVLVNAYTDRGTGDLVATRVTALTALYNLYLPIAVR